MKSDMVWWVKRQMPESVHPIIDQMRTDQLEAAIENTYDGGLAHFVEVYGNVYAESVDDAHLDPQIALRRRFRTTLGRPYAIAACHQLIRVDSTETRVKVVLRVIDEEERGTRLIQRGARIRLLVFDAQSTRLLPDECLEVDDLDWTGDVYVNSHLKMMDPDRYADKFWQHYECYRPGTDRDPRDGYRGPTRKDTLYDEYEAFKTVMESAS